MPKCGAPARRYCADDRGGGHRGCEATAPEALAEKPAFSLVGPIASDRRLGRHNLRRLHRAVELADHLPLTRGRQEFVYKKNDISNLSEHVEFSLKHQLITKLFVKFD